MKNYTLISELSSPEDFVFGYIIVNGDTLLEVEYDPDDETRDVVRYYELTGSTIEELVKSAREIPGIPADEEIFVDDTAFFEEEFGCLTSDNDEAFYDLNEIFR